MKLNVKPQTALNFTALSVYFVSSWPPPKFLSRTQKFWFHFRWWFSIIFFLLLLLTLVNSLHQHHDDPVKIINSVCLSAATISAVLKLLICRAQWSRLRVLHMKMNEFIANADELDKKYLKKYINRSAIFHGIFTISIYLVVSILIIEPALVSRPFPTDGSYPFVIKYETLRILLYIQQIISLFLIASALTIDCQVAVLLWFTGIQFEILGERCKRVLTKADLNYCIIKHQYILRYANQVRRAVSFITLSTVATTTIGIICGCLAIITSLPTTAKIRVGNILINAAIELFIYAWPGDNLIRKSQDIGWKIYQCRWIDGSMEMAKNIRMIIQRSQRPVTITINGFIPTLSFQYYASFLSSTFSYFTTLRIILSKTDE